MNFPEPATLLSPTDGTPVGDSTTSPFVPLTVGMMFGGYRIERVVGGGGMGQVYEAFDAELLRSVAIKVMRPERAADPDARERFVREARALAAVSNPHVVTIHHVSQHDGQPFLVMELVAGETLEAHLKNGALPLLQLLHTAREIAGGLAAAHRAGVVHRDVKPDNVVVSSADGRAKLIDFGLAHTARLGDDGNTSVGTPLYMAPEQVRGAAVTARTDLFSLGVLLYRMATGRTPFEGGSVNEWRDRLLSADPPTPVEELNPTIPPPLAAVTRRLLEKDPDDRPESARVVEWELASVLQEVASQSGVFLTPRTDTASNAGGTPVLSPRRRWLPWWLVAVGFAVAVVFIVLLVLNMFYSSVTIIDPEPTPPATPAEVKPTTPSEPAPKPVRLFDGRSLSGWHGVNGKTDHWSVRDGVLVGQPKPGGDQYLLTDVDYTEYTLAFDFRWPDKGDHTSVLVRAAEEGGAVSGLDVNLYLGPDEATTKDEQRLYANPRHAAGGVYKLRGPTTPVQNVPLGKWNSVKVTNTTARLTVEWNGRVTFDEALADHAAKRNELPALGRTAGGIALRTHRYMPVEYRNLVVRPLK